MTIFKDVWDGSDFFCVLPIDNFAGLVYNVARECLMVCLELSIE